MTLKESRTINYDANIQYLLTLVRGKALRQFETLSAEIGSSTPENLTSIILGLGAYFFPVNDIPKQNHTKHHGMRRPHV